MTSNLKLQSAILDNANYDELNSEDDEIQYLNLTDTTLSEYEQEGDGVHTKRTGKLDAAKAPSSTVDSKDITNQKQTKQNKERADKLSKGTYLQEPVPRPPLRPIKTPKLQKPTSVTRQPSIMMSTDSLLEQAASQLNLSEPLAARIDIITSQSPPPEWHALATLTLSQLHKAATDQNPQLASLLNHAHDLLTRTPPLAPAEAITRTHAILSKSENIELPRLKLATDLAHDNDNDPETALSIIWGVSRNIVTDPKARRQLPDNVLASLDSLHQESQMALDGIALQRAMSGLPSTTHDNPLPPRPNDNRPDAEIEVLRHTKAHDTLKDVYHADKLLSAILDEANPDPHDQYEDNKRYALNSSSNLYDGTLQDTPPPPEHEHPPHALVAQTQVHYKPAQALECCNDCIYFQSDGQPCERVQGPIFHNMICDLFETKHHPTVQKSGEMPYLGPQQQNDVTATRQTTDGTTPYAAPQVSGLNHSQDDPYDSDNDPATPTIAAPDDGPRQINRDTTPSVRGTAYADAHHTGTYLHNNPNDETVESTHPPSSQAPISKAEVSARTAMLAWYPTTGQAQQLSRIDGEKPEELHMTVIYFGKITDEQIKTITGVVQAHTLRQRPMNGTITGVGMFPASDSSDGRDVLVALVDAPGLSLFRAQLVADLTKHGIKIPMDHDFIAHISLEYGTDGEALLRSRMKTKETTPISISELHLVQGDNFLHTFSLDQGVGEISPFGPEDISDIESDDKEAQQYAEFFAKSFDRGSHDSRYSLALVKSDAGKQHVIPLD